MNKESNVAPINEDLNVVKNEVEEIKQKIYFIRGKQVILDSDIAEKYEVETKKLNQAVKRNMERFPEQFCFQLTEVEFENLRSQIVTSSLNKNNYVDIDTLNILSKKNDKVDVKIYTKKETKLNSKDINKFNTQYPKLEVKYTEKFHDRFLILDKKYIYHIGASLKDLGKKCFGITLIKYEAIIDDILSKLE